MMDYIIKLPPLKDTVTGIIYDSILVIVDWLTKYARFIPCREKKSADKLAKTLLKKIVSNHGILQSIILNRDKLFTSEFWNSWTRQLGIKIKLFMAYHLQTERPKGQTQP